MPESASSKHILIADDSNSVRTALAGQLRAAGYIVSLAQNGQEAVLKAKELIPDCITLDVDMPIYNGYEACSLIRQIPALQRVPILFITSNDTHEDRIKGFNLGAIDFLSKMSKNLFGEVLRAVNHIMLPAEFAPRLEALVVQDNPMSELIIDNFLQRLGVELVRATSTKAALTELDDAEKPFGLILCQYRSEAIDGAAISHKARSLSTDAHTPIIFFCNDNDAKQSLTMFRAGATDFIVEPYTREILTGRLSTHIEAQRLIRKLSSETEKSSLILQAAGEGIIGLDINGNVTFSNAAASKMLGWSPEELSGKDLHELTHHTTKDGLAFPPDDCPIRQSFQSGERAEIGADIFWTKNGGQIPVRYLSTPQNLDGKTIGAVVTFYDISERLKLDQLKEDVQRITRHDLKSPLSAIIGLPALLKVDDNITPSQLEILATIEKAGYRMLQMINLSLDLYKMEQGTYQFSPERVDLSSLFQTMVNEHEQLIGAKKLVVKLPQEGSELQCIAYAEELLCLSLLANLFRNACEASPKGGTITISCKTDQWVIISMHNEGMVPAEIQPKFFEKYVTAGKKEGTGLGTYSARLMAETQGGSLQMTTSEAEGTTLLLTLPLASNEDGSQTSVKVKGGAKGVPPAALTERPLQILVAEDDFVNQQFILALLEQEGWQTTLVPDGQQAIDACRRQRFDIIFMDLQMPIIDGFTASREIRDNTDQGHNTPIIALSADTLSAERSRQLKAAGMTSYLAKPFQADELYELIARLID